MIYFPVLFYGYGSLLVLAAVGAILFFWIVLGSGRVPMGLIYSHITLALITFGLMTWAVVLQAQGIR